MTRIMGVTRVRRGFTDVVNRADEHSEPIYLVNFNEPRAVLVGYQAWEDLMGRLEDLVSIYRGREEPTRPLDEFLAELAREEAAEQQPVAALVV